jgi:hypothetical protein
MHYIEDYLTDALERVTEPWVVEYDIDDWWAFADELVAEGYTPGNQLRLIKPLIGDNSIDRQVAEAAICPVHIKPSEYRPYYFHNPRGRGEYRAFAVCTACNKATEF